MKFRVRMILAYSTVAVLVSLVLGLLMYRSGDRYERNTQRNSLEVSARSYVTQMDDRLGRMDAILYYILSDPSMLESMTLLGRASDGNIPGNFLMQAKNTMEVGISTEYIMRNSYRSVYFNEDGFFASSAVRQSGYDALNQRLIEDYALEEVDYLDPVIEGDGHSVIVGPHTDFWGAYGSVQVYSMMKAPRGNHLGFLEVENRIDSLKSLASSDPDIRFAILVNDNELLYASDPEMEAPGIAGSMQPVEILSRIDDALLGEGREKSRHIISELTGAEGVKGVTGMGLMLGVETEKPASEVIAACMERGVLVLKAKNKVRLLPALNIPPELLQKAINVLKEACK